MDTTIIADIEIMHIIIFKRTMSIFTDWFSNFIERTFRMKAAEGKMERLIRLTVAPARAVNTDELGIITDTIPGSRDKVMYTKIRTTNGGAFGKHIKFFHFIKLNWKEFTACDISGRW